MTQIPVLAKNFPNGQQAWAVRTNGKTEPASIAEALKLPNCLRLLLISGGAGSMSDESYSRLTTLFATLGETVAQTGCTVIDGGTQAGVMQLMGEALAQSDQAPPHIGVLPARAKAGPNGILAEDILEPHHSYFVLVESDEWGGEVETMYKLAGHLSATAPSVAVLVNGGGISLREIEQNVEQGREIIVIVGSGRLADEIAEAVLHPEREARDRIKAVVQHGRFTLFDLETSPDFLAQLILQRFT